MSKKNYDTPKVKVVAFQVEEGFAGSPTTRTLNVGLNPDAGTEGYTDQSSWSGTYINN